MDVSYQYSYVRVFAPASVANVSCGFDVMGFALNKPGDDIIVRPSDTDEVSITSVTGDEGLLPKESSKNTAGVAVQAFFDHIGFDGGIEIEVHKKMPLGSGLGSSAASSAGAVWATNCLLGKPMSRKELLPFAAEGERIACGSAHYDNVAPSLLGGFVFIRSSDPPDLFNIPFPEQLHAAVLHPHIEIKTEETRKILRKNISLRKAVTQWGNVGGLVAGLMQKDLGLIGRSLQDVIIEPTRSVLIPGFDAVKDAALAKGALGAGISGSGPSIFALSPNKKKVEAIGSAMKAELDAIHLSSDLYISPINSKGAQIKDVE